MIARIVNPFFTESIGTTQLVAESPLHSEVSTNVGANLDPWQATVHRNQPTKD
jgi:hypothetical protein